MIVYSEVSFLIKERLHMTNQIQALSAIVSPAKADLKLVLFKSKQGIEIKGVDTYEGVMSFSEYASHFDCELTADELSEQHKNQRDVSAARKKSLCEYLLEREDLVLPSATIFVSDLVTLNSHQIGNRAVVEARLPLDADRFVCDGQGRLVSIRTALETKPELADLDIAFKLIVTKTNLVAQRTDIVKQIFVDYHFNVTKPTTSQCMYFNGASPYSLLLEKLLDINVGETRVVDLIGLHGTIRNGHVWKFSEFAEMIKIYLDASISELDQALSDPNAFSNALRHCSEFIINVVRNLPLQSLAESELGWKKAHANVMFTRSLCAKAFGWVGRSLVEDSIVTGMINWSAFDKLVDIPLSDQSADLWLRAGCITSEVKNGVKKYKIVRSSEKIIARTICHQLRILPAEGL